MDLSERKLKVLTSIVELYIETGEPVGSKILANQLGVSSATIRNEMAELSQMGFLHQPHTSAGRIPSQKSYRLYIDQGMNQIYLSQEQQMYINSLIASAYDLDSLLLNASKILADLTHLAAVSAASPGSSAHVRAIQFVQISRHTAMVILITSIGTMKPRLFHCDFELNTEMLRVFFYIFNDNIAGMEVSGITPAFIQSLGVSTGALAILISPPLMALLEVVQELAEAEINLNGQMNLLFHPEVSREESEGILDFLRHPQELANFLLQQKNGVHVLLGEETNRPELLDFSLIIARYAIAGQFSGAFAVIGPTRMDYAKWIANMHYLSHSIAQIFNHLCQEN